MTARNALTPAQQQALREALRTLLGLRLRPGRQHGLESGTHHVLERLGLEGVEDLLGRLTARDPQVLDAVATEFTVGETYFFRNEQPLQFVKDRVLSGKADVPGRIRLWSAGCATGEEAYSLAITALETLGPQAGAKVEILGTDVNPSFLEQARQGCYGAWSFRRAPATLKERWFHPEGRTWSVVSEVRRLVRFRRLNLVEGPTGRPGPAPPAAWPTGMHAILCLNVLMYLEPEASAEVMRVLVDSLVPGGWLLLGPTDPGPPRDLSLSYETGQPSVYCKATPARHPTLPPSTPPVATTDRAGEVPSLSSHDVPVAGVPEPGGLEDPLERARQLIDQGEAAAALVALSRAPPDQQLRAGYHLLRATIEASLGDDREAVRAAGRALMLDPSLVIAQVLAASAHLRLGEHDAARRALRHAMRLLRGLPEDHPVPHAGGASGRDLLAVCRQLETSLGDVPPSSRSAG